MILIDFAVLIVIYFVFFFGRLKKQGLDVFLSRTLMYIYMSFVIYFTLMPIIAEIPYITSHFYKPMNLNPFEDIILSHKDAVKQVVLNVIMTVPYGILYPITHKNKKFIFLKTVFSVFLISLFIELIQPIISERASDITDIITNTAGGIIGFLIYLIFKPLAIKALKAIKKL